MIERIEKRQDVLEKRQDKFSFSYLPIWVFSACLMILLAVTAWAGYHLEKHNDALTKIASTQKLIVRELFKVFPDLNGGDR